MLLLVVCCLFSAGSSLRFCVVMLDVLGHGVWALAVEGAVSSWEELLGASLA